MTCFACAGAIDDADRFCGHCGADQSRAPSVSSVEPPRPGRPPTVEYLDAPPRKSRFGRAVAVVLTMAGLGAIAAVAYTAWFRSGESNPVRIALGGFGVPLGIEPAAEPTDEPSPEPTEAEEAEEGEETDPAPAEAAAASAPAASALLQPGRWQFSTQLVSIAKVNPADQFEISRQGIGASEAHSICVTPAIAENPRSIAFPLPPGLGCSPTAFSMADGSYRSSMTCSFPQFGGRRPVIAGGRYSRSELSLEVNVRVPAQVVSGDFDQPPELLMQYRIQGYLTGPC